MKNLTKRRRKMSNGNIDWKVILQQLVAAVLPAIIKLILEWLQGLTDEEAVAVGRRAGMLFNAARKEVA